METLTAEHILTQLDGWGKEYTFPMLDHGYIALADARLSAYGDSKHWALLIEILGMDVRFGGHDMLTNTLYCFGNGCTVTPGLTSRPRNLTEDGDDGAVFLDENVWQVRPGVQTLRLCGDLISITADPAYFEERGLPLEKPPDILAIDLLRMLALDYRDQLFLAEEDLQQYLVSDLPLLLRLDAWQHPDLMNDELPSTTETFRLLAEVFATGDPTHYQPTLSPNTHWDNWPEAGTLCVYCTDSCSDEANLSMNT
ncbi:MAG: hypothetical protein AAGF95_08545 [Chloroflexota bacterium]